MMLRMDLVKLIDVLTSLTVNHSILPRVVCLATSLLEKYMRHVVISAAVDRHLSQSKNVFCIDYRGDRGKMIHFFKIFFPAFMTGYILLLLNV